MKQKLVATVPGVLMLLGAMFHSTAVDAQSSPSAYTKGYRYDAAGRPTGTIAPDPDGAGPLHFRAVRNTYDSVGNLTAVETGNLAAWKSETIAPANWGADFKADTILNNTYDALGRKTIERTHGVEASGSTLLMAVTQYSYDAQGRPECTAVRMNPGAFANLPSSACALGTEGSFGPDRITRQVYDAAGQLRTLQKAYGTPLQQDYATYTYTPNGSVETATDAKGNKTQYTYDGHDRLKRWKFPHKTNIGSIDEADFEEYGYDENANRTSLRKRDERTITYSFDALNRVRVKTVPTSATGATGYAVYNDYDLRGLPLYARFSSDSGEGITNTFDGAGRLRLSRSNLGGVTRDVASDYDADGNRTRVTHPDGNYFEYAHDGLDRFLNLSQNGPSTTLASLSYDAQGRRDKIARDALGTATQYGYDPISRLTALTHDLDGAGTNKDLTMGYVYNPSSQIVTRSLTNNAYEFPVASSSLTYAANGLNQYTQISGDAPATLGWDANGNLTSDGVTTFSYDSENRLRSASGAKNATLTYDPFGRLYQVATGSAITSFVYDGDRLIAEYDASGTLLRRYVHGPGADEPVVWYEGAQVSAANRRYLHANHQGSIVAVTGASGNTLQVNTYDPYGIAAAGNTGRFQYTGQAAIPELGLLYYKARMYSPHLGRFMQTDPVGYDDDVNLYAYVSNDPLNRTDPSGLVGVPRGPVTGRTGNPVTFKQAASFVADFVPIVGDVKGAVEFAENPTVLGGLAVVVGLVPLVGDVAGKGIKWVDRLGDAAKSSCCFVAGTLVETVGGLKPIEQIAVGDLVLSRDVETGATDYRAVTNLIRRHERIIWTVTLVGTGDVRATFETTDDHPWWIAGKGWVRTENLVPGMALVTANGRGMVVESVDEMNRKESTYNLTVADFETYFVGEQRVLVHNCPSGIYEFPEGAGKYVGQSADTDTRLGQHVNSGRLDSVDNAKVTEVPGDKTAREVAEHNRIQEITGGVPARQSDAVTNQRDPIGPNRQDLLKPK